MVPKTPLAVEFNFLEYGHPTTTPRLLEDFILTTFLTEELILHLNHIEYDRLS